MSIYLYLNEQQSGPYSEAQLRAMLAAGTISPAQLAWRDGLPGWQPLNTILSIAPVPPPPPPRPPPPPKLKRGLMQCKACGNPVSKSAKSCPSCGAPRKRRSGCGGCLVLIVLIIIIGAAISSVSPQGGTQTAIAPAPGSAPTTTPPAPAASTSSQSPQKEADAFIGMTEQQVINKLGQPTQIKKDDSPDGPYEMLVYDDTNSNATLFVIFDKDGKVSSGSYHGLTLTESNDKLSSEDRAKEEQDLFFSELNALDKDHAFFKSVQVQDGWAKIVVKDAFHVAPYQSRLQMTQNLVKMWRAIHSPNNDEVSSLTLTDYNGNEVGGTGLTGVWVQKEQ